MKIYLAALGCVKNELINGAITPEDVYCLESFYAMQDWFKSFIPRFKSFLLDSGAFTFLQNAKKHDSVNWDKYIESYADFINAHDIQLFFELDIDKIIGLDKVDYYRERLEKLTGKKPIPVWHINRGKQYFIDMCKNYPYVALGGLAIREISKTKYEKAFPWFIQTAHEHNAKIHGLGYTIIEKVGKYNFDSVDSTTWTAGTRFGQIHIFENGSIKKYNSVENGKKIRNIKDAKNSNIINFKEWNKFQKYADKKF